MIPCIHWRALLSHGRICLHVISHPVLSLPLLLLLPVHCGSSAVYCRGRCPRQPPQHRHRRSRCVNHADAGIGQSIDVCWRGAHAEWGRRSSGADGAPFPSRPPAPRLPQCDVLRLLQINSTKCHVKYKNKISTQITHFPSFFIPVSKANFQLHSGKLKNSDEKILPNS